MRTAYGLASCLLIACGSPTRGASTTDGNTPNSDGHATTDGTAATGDGANDGCAGITNCYSVYAHSDDTLYEIDLSNSTLQTVGKFNAPNVGSDSQPDVITDLAVAPDGTIWAISETALYTASPTDGHVTVKGSLSACGSRGVALTFLANGMLYEGDFKGALCNIDITGATPVVGAPVTLSGGMALAGDIVGIGDGTVFGTLYKLSDPTNRGTNLSNVLGTIDVTTGQVTPLGASGYPKLFGTSFAHNKVIGFTHDGTGHVVEMDPTTGAGTLYATFTDPTSGSGISFAGAGVNALVNIIQ